MVVFPTPPFWLAMVTMRPMALLSSRRRVSSEDLTHCSTWNNPNPPGPRTPAPAFPMERRRTSAPPRGRGHALGPEPERGPTALRRDAEVFHVEHRLPAGPEGGDGALRPGERQREAPKRGELHPGGEARPRRAPPRRPRARAWRARAPRVRGRPGRAGASAPGRRARGSPPGRPAATPPAPGSPPARTASPRTPKVELGRHRLHEGHLLRRAVAAGDREVRAARWRAGCPEGPPRTRRRAATRRPQSPGAAPGCRRGASRPARPGR